MKKAVKDRFEELILVLVLIFVALEVIIVGVKLIATGVELYGYTIQVDAYNSNPVKTDRMTEIINEVNLKREALYNSDDLIIRCFSQSNVIIKAFILGLVGCSFYMVIYFTKRIVKTTIQRIKRARRRRK